MQEEKTSEKKAVILLSGGLDSATTLAIAANKGYQCLCLSFRYGQRHSTEIESAKKIAKSLGASDHRIIDINLAQFGGSALTDPALTVPKNTADLEDENQIPITYVPARNLVFLSLALSYAEVSGAFDIFIGVNTADYSGYPDCRGEFVSSFEQTANLATAAAIKNQGRYTIQTPIISMTKAEIITTGTNLGVDYSLSHSCYDPDPAGRACGQCDSCRLRLKGFAEAGLTDPVEYKKC